jgi:hypothetical protein
MVVGQARLTRAVASVRGKPMRGMQERGTMLNALLGPEPAAVTFARLTGPNSAGHIDSVAWPSGAAWSAAGNS